MKINHRCEVLKVQLAQKVLCAEPENGQDLLNAALSPLTPFALQQLATPSFPLHSLSFLHESPPLFESSQCGWPLRTSCALSLWRPLSLWRVTGQRAVNLYKFSLLAQGLMFYILYSWIHSLHSWRINMDILRPRCFLCCASKDRKWISWLLIGWQEKEVMVWYERNSHTQIEGDTNAE